MVVVLIIGILAAIAVPQYQKAVEKSRMAEGLLINKTIEDAIQRLILNNGSVPHISGQGMLDWFDIELPLVYDDANTCFATKNFCVSVFCMTNTNYCHFKNFRIRNGKKIYAFQSTVRGDMDIPRRECWTQETAEGLALCKQASGYTVINTTLK